MQDLQIFLLRGDISAESSAPPDEAFWTRRFYLRRAGVGFVKTPSKRWLLYQLEQVVNTQSIRAGLGKTLGQKTTFLVALRQPRAIMGYVERPWWSGTVKTHSSFVPMTPPLS